MRCRLSVRTGSQVVCVGCGKAKALPSARRTVTLFPETLSTRSRVVGCRMSLTTQSSGTIGILTKQPTVIAALEERQRAKVLVAFANVTFGALSVRPDEAAQRT